MSDPKTRHSLAELIYHRRERKRLTKLTPYEVARKRGLQRVDVLRLCEKWGVGIFEGRIILEEFDRARAENDRSCKCGGEPERDLGRIVRRWTG